MMTNRFAILLAAPHRLPFLVGVANLTCVLFWWLARLLEILWGPHFLPSSAVPPILVHGPVMLFLIFPPFILGFLLTVFPRWMGYPDLAADRFGPVAVGMALGSFASLAGLYASSNYLLVAGLTVQAISWIWALPVLSRIVWCNRQDGKAVCWHALSAALALVCGLAGLALFIWFLASGDERAWQVSRLIGTLGFLLPMFFTVAHRMVPFFAGNVVAGYRPWRPFWMLAAFWLASLAQLALRLGAVSGPLLSISCLVLAGIGGITVWKWWPRSPAPAFLMVLLWALTWLPIAFILAAYDAARGLMGVGADHALYLGFALGMVIAMVTRVTQGHSGRPLAMPRTGWIASAAVQTATVLRVFAAYWPEQRWLLTLAIGSLVLGMTGWNLRNAKIYLVRRRDGKPG
jgi:uncharacterized protein involved in response to NO